MSEDKKVISLADARAQKSHENGERLFERGLAFKFKEFKYSDEPPHGVGLIEGEAPVCFPISEDGMEGLCMTRGDAMALGIALCEAAETDAPPEEDFIPPPKKGA